MACFLPLGLRVRCRSGLVLVAGVVTWGAWRFHGARHRGRGLWLAGFCAWWCIGVCRIGSKLLQGLLDALQGFAYCFPDGAARCVGLSNALHLVELLKEILLVLWERFVGLVSG